MQSLWKSVSSGWVPGPFGVTLKQAEKVGHRAFWELRSLVARSLSSLKKKKSNSLSTFKSNSILDYNFFKRPLFFYFMLLKFHFFFV